MNGNINYLVVYQILDQRLEELENKKKITNLEELDMVLISDTLEDIRQTFPSIKKFII